MVAPVRGLVYPGEFIEIAEESGLVSPLGNFVLNQACQQFVRWQRDLGDEAPDILSVNISRAQLGEAGLIDQVRAALQASGLDARHLQLEVTESLAAQGDEIQARLHELKALGLLIALDDFGPATRHSRAFTAPGDVVKIDRSFVIQAETSTHHRVLIDATVRLARSLGMQTVAEGWRRPAGCRACHCIATRAKATCSLGHYRSGRDPLLSDRSPSSASSRVSRATCAPEGAID